MLPVHGYANGVDLREVGYVDLIFDQRRRRWTNISLTLHRPNGS